MVMLSDTSPNAQRTKIIVIGGYGHVGQTICRLLAVRYPGQVYAAGRSYARAQAFSTSEHGRVLPLQLDVGAPPDPELLAQTRLVIMCLDQTDTAFMAACLAHGADYLDVSAYYPFVQQAEQLHERVRHASATAILSVGLVPGLSNLMAAAVHARLDQTERIDISLMLGLGDNHGQAAIAWTVDHMAHTFEGWADGRKRRIASFTDGRRVDLGATLGVRTGYRFPFPDQLTLGRTLGVPQTATRLLFDSRPLTGLLAIAARIGLLSVLRLRPAAKAMTAAMGALQFGSDQYALHVEATGQHNNAPATSSMLLTGRNEGDMTARVAAAIAGELLDKPQPPGVYHSEQRFDLARILTRIDQTGVDYNLQELPVTSMHH